MVSGSWASAVSSLARYSFIPPTPINCAFCRGSSSTANTAPRAPIEVKCSGTINWSPRAKTSLIAFLMPAFAATPPIKAMGFLTSLPLAMLLLKFLARAKQRPATSS